jgi:hypothetical protein
MSLTVLEVTVDMVLLKQNLNRIIIRTSKSLKGIGRRRYLYSPPCVAEKEYLFSVSRVAE